jgi:hypothetical protein
VPRKNITNAAAGTLNNGRGDMRASVIGIATARPNTSTSAVIETVFIMP